MDSRSAPGRLRTLPSWLIAQLASRAQQIVGARFAESGAHRYQYSMLTALEESGPQSQASLGRRVGLDRSDVAAAVAELEEQHLVERAPDPADRRRNMVRITRAGVRRLRALDRAVDAGQDELLAPLTSAERKQLVALITRVLDHHAASR